jgi:hypothetical protein
MSDTLPQRQADLATRVLAGWFGGVWFAFLFVLIPVFWWVRDMFLVAWVYGWHGYFHDGIRVLRGKPIMFSTGQPAPLLPDLVTGFGYFISVVGGLTILLTLGLRIYERAQKKRSFSKAE